MVARRRLTPFSRLFYLFLFIAITSNQPIQRENGLISYKSSILPNLFVVAQDETDGPDPGDEGTDPFEDPTDTSTDTTDSTADPTDAAIEETTTTTKTSSKSTSSVSTSKTTAKSTSSSSQSSTMASTSAQASTTPVVSTSTIKPSSQDTPVTTTTACCDPCANALVQRDASQVEDVADDFLFAMPHGGSFLERMYPKRDNPNCINCPLQWSKKRTNDGVDMNWFCKLPCCDPCTGKTLREREIDDAVLDPVKGMEFAKRWSCRACVKPPNWYCRLPCCGNICLPNVTCRACGNYRKRDDNLFERTNDIPSDCPPFPPCDCNCNPLNKRDEVEKREVEKQVKAPVKRHESLSCIYCPEKCVSTTATSKSSSTTTTKTTTTAAQNNAKAIANAKANLNAQSLTTKKTTTVKKTTTAAPTSTKKSSASRLYISGFIASLLLLF